MEVKQIVVDELLDGYKNKKSVVEVEIYASYINESNKYVTEYYHNFIDNPLQVEDECVYTGEYGGYDEYGDVIFFSKKTTCSDSHFQKVSIPNNTFCPNCGKRIRYEEE